MIAVTGGDWVIAEIRGTRGLRRALRDAILPEDISFDPDDGLWRIRHTAWGAACAVFWRFQISVETYEAPGGDTAIRHGAAPAFPDDAIKRAHRLAAFFAPEDLDQTNR